MNCRRICGLLSAYLDAELTLNEMELIGVHLNECPHCRGEYQALLDTKRLLSSLANRTSRAEIDSLLRAEGDHRFADVGASSLFRGALRPRPLTATVVLSLAGLWIASASLDSSTDGAAPGSGGFPAPMSAAAVPNMEIGMRGLRYLNDAFRGTTGPELVPVSADALALPSGNPYSVSGAPDMLRDRHSVSLSNVLATTTAGREQTGQPMTISVYTVSGGGSGMYSVSVQSNYRSAPVSPSVMH